MSEWQRIETAPKDGTFFIFWNGETVGSGRFINESSYFAADSFHGKPARNPTHWQPIPDPPKAEAVKEYIGG